jgi:hypothetical protein
MLICFRRNVAPNESNNNTGDKREIAPKSSHKSLKETAQMIFRGQ